MEIIQYSKRGFQAISKIFVLKKISKEIKNAIENINNRIGLTRMKEQIKTQAFQSTIRQQTKVGVGGKNEEKYRNLETALKEKILGVMMRIFEIVKG